MGIVTVNDSTLTDIADAIRDKLEVETTYKPSEMAEAIESISSGGITPTGTIEITQNGVVDVTNYASADVDVSGGVTPTGTKQISITENGTTTEDVTNYASAEITVNVPTGGGGNFATGTYAPEANANSWSIDVGGDYSHFIIYASIESAGQGVRAIRAIICDFTQASSARLVVTTNNTGSGIQGFYYTTGYVTKNGSIMSYSNSGNYFPANIPYVWIAW